MGVGTAGLGLVVLGAAALTGRRPRLVSVARLAGVAALAIAFGFALRVWIVPEYFSYGPQLGFIATALGGLIAAVGDPRLRAGPGQWSMSRRAGQPSTEPPGGRPETG